MSPLKPRLVPKEWRAVHSPWLADDDLARVLILRGAILWSYSHVERRLLDVALRCSRTPEYRNIDEKAPFRRATRIGYLQKVLEAEGPLSPFRRLGEVILKRYEAGAEIRNQMAHADIDFLGLGLTRFKELTVDGNRLTLTDRTFNFAPGELERHAIKAARLSKAVQRLHYKAFADDPISASHDHATLA